ncbi:uncharacterized protein LOC115750958 [Rhodamnia argentea]|uniref:Uncharacterized protein LOC115750958 n=1 Tax=Rhodamnia argentea TaxID=178133 RepID=A0A8B8QBF2_9MYRT|nr:uncharacterized protein LOC115750958 [Rhodamnia argentea]
MPSTPPPQSPSPPTAAADLQALLDAARPFLRGELEVVDPRLPSLVATLRSVGAGECWHKHGSFLEHLVDIYRVLRLWRVPDAVCLCGLFHSAYSNSYVNLAIFDPNTGRDVVRSHVGDAAERLIHLFCIIPRHTIIHDDLLFRYDDAELVEHLKLSEMSLRSAKEKGVFRGDEAWRKKVQSLLPAEGIRVKHIKTGEEVLVSRRVIATFLMMTMADFSDQLFGFQDMLFENSDGRLEFTGNNFWALWPGDGKPGLWMNSISRMGAVYMLVVREEEMFMLERRKKSSKSNADSEPPAEEERDEDIELVVPPVFESCTRVLGAREQIEARDKYWEAVCEVSGGGGEQYGAVERRLRESVEKNPFVGEPRVVLGQVYLGEGRYEEAEREAEAGLRLLLEWGSPWDKRTSWEGWVAWARVLLMKARERSWPNTSWGILNLGLVK